MSTSEINYCIGIFRTCISIMDSFPLSKETLKHRAEVMVEERFVIEVYAQVRNKEAYEEYKV